VDCSEKVKEKGVNVDICRIFKERNYLSFYSLARFL
jgi:hypothetical protein